tara:strand:+ start:935 stop:1114 length:180 start_codon:yes stop_codon:yes gene_type:complete
MSKAYYAKREFKKNLSLHIGKDNAEKYHHYYGLMEMCDVLESIQLQLNEIIDHIKPMED